MIAEYLLTISLQLTCKFKYLFVYLKIKPDRWSGVYSLLVLFMVAFCLAFVQKPVQFYYHTQLKYVEKNKNIYVLFSFSLVSV